MKEFNTNTNHTLTWDKEDQFIALLCVQENPKSYAVFQGMSDELFSDVISHIIASCQPLSQNEIKHMTESVKSNDRIRIAYHTTCLALRHIQASLDTTAYVEDEGNNELTESETYKNLIRVFGSKSFNITTEEEMVKQDEISKQNYPNDTPQPYVDPSIISK